MIMSFNISLRLKAAYRTFSLMSLKLWSQGLLTSSKIWKNESMASKIFSRIIRIKLTTYSTEKYRMRGFSCRSPNWVTGLRRWSRKLCGRSYSLDTIPTATWKINTVYRS